MPAAKPITTKTPSPGAPATQRRYLTRRAALPYVNEKHGIPVKKSTIDKKPPRADAFYGKVELYYPETIDDWALKELVGDKKFKLGAG